jgi:ABC-type antimicrobial peptide transport system permease subunit
MSETFFPVNDLLRRKLQTSLIIISLTLCVASTVFLLLFCENIGFSVSLMVENKLTTGFSIVFSQFIIFITILIFVVGAVIVSFMVFIMMSQRIRDIGLMKAAGCPNDLAFGYFITELLIVAFVACFLGVILGILADFASTTFFSNADFQILQKPINFWLILIVFALYLALALGFGAKPILDTAKITPVKALSPVHYFGLGKEPGFRVISKSGLTTKIALRSLFRHKSAATRIILCLIAVFILATIGIAGGLIADQTTKSWVANAIGKDIILIAHHNISRQYIFLLSKFYGAEENSPINYTDEKYLINDIILNSLHSITGISGIEQRLILETHVKEVQGIVIDPETQSYIEIGDSHAGRSLIIGIEPEKVLSKVSVNGQFLKTDEAWNAVVGDSVAQKMFSEPLSQKIEAFSTDFNITGVCLDPINNGNVTYVRLKDLQDITGISKTNVVMVRIDSSANRSQVLNLINQTVENLNPAFDVNELDGVLDKNLSFIGYIWSSVMFLPLLSLFSASICLIGYVTLTISEQRQEYGVFRALGAKPSTIVKMVAAQSLVVSLGSFAAGLAFGIIITLLVLVPEPVVTAFTIIEIAGWMLTALALTFSFSLIPAIRFAKKPLLELMTQL